MSVNEQEPRQDQANATGEGNPSRRAWIMRGLVTPILGMLAVASIVLGALNATIWKPSSVIDATAHIGGTRYIVTDPGVLPLVDAKATLTVKSDAADQVCVALAAGKDINGWIGDDGYTRVTGLESWTALSTQKQAGKSGDAADSADGGADGGDTGDTAATDTAATGVAFKDSDMWDDVTCDAGSVTMTTDIAADATDAPMAIIDLGAEGDADVTLHWVRQTLPDFAMPFYFAGGLLAVTAVLTASVFAMPPHKRRKKIKAVAAAVGIGGGADDEAAFRAAARRGDGSTDGSADGSARADAAGTAAGTLGTAVGAAGALAGAADAAASGATAAEAAEEVTIREALAGTFASLKPSFGRRKRRRHAAGHAPAAGRSGAEDNGQPTIVDPRARNIVADTAAAAASGSDAASSGNATTGREVAGGSTGDTGTETSVITAEELQAYFARLAQESAGAAVSGSTGYSTGLTGSAGSDDTAGGSEPSSFAPAATGAATDDGFIEEPGSTDNADRIVETADDVTDTADVDESGDISDGDEATESSDDVESVATDDRGDSADEMDESSDESDGDELAESDEPSGSAESDGEPDESNGDESDETDDVESDVETAESDGDDASNDDNAQNDDEEDRR
ncbi:hypothetical protein [Bifidobacterium samirii]|uniref:GTPase regulator-like protein n=1 Tax=Bifidobacterium samirii TaxID=2306974 RepID=A0A430FR30_9BIFI|nr:hypothetical protein [Bifidobacterium samirii]RSX55278.1 hypothetical protein D2E24_1413 [Bifidobacterium samirii]